MTSGKTILKTRGLRKEFAGFFAVRIKRDATSSEGVLTLS